MKLYSCFRRRLTNKELGANLKTSSKRFPVWQILFVLNQPKIVKKVVWIDLYATKETFSQIKLKL